MAAESMEPANRDGESSTRDMSSQSQACTGLGPDRQIEDTEEVVASAPTRSGSIPGSPATPGRGITPKIAGLKATFERPAGDWPAQPLKSPGRWEKSRTPEQAREQDSLAVTAKDEEIARLQRQLGQETARRQEFEDKCVRLQEESGRWEAQLDRQEDEWRAELSRQNGALVLERDKAQHEFVEIKRQLLGLKRSISVSTRLDNQVPDSSFTSDMQHLHHELQNWVVNSFRRVKMNKSSTELLACLESVVKQPRHLDYLRPLFHEWDPAMKLPALQAVAIRHINDIWSEPLLFGLPAWRNGVQAAAEILRTVLPLAAYHKWQAITLDMLKQDADIKDAVDSATTALTDTICTILVSLTGAEESTAMVSSLNVIIRRAVSLSHVFRVQQRAQYEFILPEPGAPFEPYKMDDTSFESCPSSHAISFATFPLVIKHNQVLEEGIPPSSIVVKAKVLRRPWRAARSHPSVCASDGVLPAALA